MKKITIWALCFTLAVTAMACKPKETQPVATEAPAAATEAPAQEETAEPSAEAPTAAALKTGFAAVISVADSASAGDEDGKAKADGILVAVSVDDAGKIVRCSIDSTQTVINFAKDGKIVTDMATEFPTKQEIGADYGMAKASSIGKEWNEQIDALAAYVVGKTAEEVRGIAMTETTAPADADLAASCTISIGGYIDAIAKAADNANVPGATESDLLGLGIVTNMSKSADASADKAGVAQAYSTYAVVTVDGEGKITSCMIDASQANVNFDAAGQITSDLTAAVATKNELGENYGMAKASAIGKEWNEQAAAFAAYCVGKTAEEVKGIAMDEQGLATDADLLASVTVHIGEFMNVVAKAVENAK